MDRKYHWPKSLPDFTEAQAAIRDDWMQYWHHVLPRRFGVVERFNHGYPVDMWAKEIRKRGITDCRTLEIGAGLGEHLRHEDLSHQQYYALELRDAMGAQIKRSFPAVHLIIGDCQKPHAELAAHSFDRIIAIHVLEHLPDLPAALEQCERLLRPGGVMQVVIPCQGGIAYRLAQIISSEWMFWKRYRQSYKWCINSEHINTYPELIYAIRQRFIIENRTCFPLLIPWYQCNLVVGLTLRPKDEPSAE